jgi:hypothetical protein
MLTMFNTNGNANFDELKVIEAAENAEQTGRRQLWERQVGESTKAYSAFQKYLNLSSRRTLREVAELSHCSGQNIARWSRRWSWVHRVQAFDTVEEERFREQAARDRLAMRRRQIALGIACQSVAAHGVHELQAKIASGSALNLGAEEIKSLLAIGSQLEGRGMGTEKDSKFTKIVVNFGHHRYPSEPCGCHCAACASCHGEGKDEQYDAMELEGGGDPKQLN